jgi:hypothetical protein
MNCEKCQELLSDFLDGTLNHTEHARLSAHLATCAECFAAREEFHTIISAARNSREYLYTPPNENALWLRVQSAVESEARNRSRAQTSSDRHEGFFSRLFNKRWELSLPQLAAGVSALVVAVAFLTTLSVQYATSGKNGNAAARADRIRRVVAEDYYPRTYLEPHEANLQYWEQRVEARKASWSPRMRASFDRSINVLDEEVNTYLSDLRQNPHDEVAEEMLNSALRDKIELLKEFGEQ